MLATIATGLFILPYFLFSALAGQIADALDKAKLVRGGQGGRGRHHGARPGRLLAPIGAAAARPPCS